MSPRDVFHDTVRRALEKEDWTITHDPYSAAFGGRNLFIDLGSEIPFAAEKEGRKIAVEVKSFVGKSEVVEFENSAGQFILYDVLVSDYEPERTLLLAVPEDVWVGLFSEQLSVKVIERGHLRCVVYNPIRENRAMEGVNLHDLCRHIIERYAKESSPEEVELRPSIDETRGEYSLFMVGWQGARRTHGPMIHLEVRSDKIWIQSDGTPEGVVDELLEVGVREKQLMLAWQHSFKRQFTPFAVS